MTLRPFVGNVPWRNPRVEPPPLGVKLFLLTAENIGIIGKWEDEARYCGWREMFDVPDDVKALQREMRGY